MLQLINVEYTTYCQLVNTLACSQIAAYVTTGAHFIIPCLVGGGGNIWVVWLDLQMWVTFFYLDLRRILEKNGMSYMNNKKKH